MARAPKSKQRARRRAEHEAQRQAKARRRRLRTMAMVAGSAILAILLLVAIWPEPDVGNTSAEAWDLPQLDGDGRVRLADFRGTPVVAAFFANWCEVCEEEIPELAALSDQLAGQVQFVGIDMMDNGQGLADAEKWGIAGKWPLARDIGNGNGSSLGALTFGARGSPLNVIYDRQGKVVQVIRGGVTPNQLVAILQQAGLLSS